MMGSAKIVPIFRATRRTARLKMPSTGGGVVRAMVRAVRGVVRGAVRGVRARELLLRAVNR